MKIPEIVLKVDVVGALWLANDQGDLDCPFDVGSGSCGSWCPHFRVRSRTPIERANITLRCVTPWSELDNLRVVEPENKGETK